MDHIMIIKVHTKRTIITKLYTTHITFTDYGILYIYIRHKQFSCITFCL